MGSRSARLVVSSVVSGAAFALAWGAFGIASSGEGTVGSAVHEARASMNYESTYGFDRTWNAAIRLVRVDMGFAITEKDPQTGYLLFEYKSNEGGGKPSSGSFELVRGKEDNVVRVVVQLPQMPTYHEKVLLDSLVKKLRQEYGDPPKRAPGPGPMLDAGSDSGLL
ncbi:MAG: hypothetical protein U0169_07840 [Polyangiaceae bacterium]